MIGDRSLPDQVKKILKSGKKTYKQMAAEIYGENPTEKQNNLVKQVVHRLYKRKIIEKMPETYQRCSFYKLTDNDLKPELDENHDLLVKKILILNKIFCNLLEGIVEGIVDRMMILRFFENNFDFELLKKVMERIKKTKKIDMEDIILGNPELITEIKENYDWDFIKKKFGFDLDELFPDSSAILQETQDEVKLDIDRRNLQTKSKKELIEVIIKIYSQISRDILC